ncbi:hypothetical protein L1887_18137 [Cichorium endivia]|nr:hypothetical protein L1887_18137 [Cichorium endivia]
MWNHFQRSYNTSPTLKHFEFSHARRLEILNNFQPIKFENIGVRVEKVKVGARLSTPCKRSDWFQNLG